MKKVFVFSLLLVSIFLIGNAGVALAQDCQDYSCTGKVTEYGEVWSILDTEVEFCIDGFEAWLNAYWVYDSYLYPAPGAKVFLGTADTYWDWAGLSVEFKGRTMNVNFSYVDYDDGFVTTLNCKPCNDCY